MIHGTARERRREATSRRIIDAAMALVQEGGLDALTMPALARAVDFTPGALYRYFDSKDVLIAELNRRVVQRIRADLDAAWARCDTARRPPKEEALLPIVVASRLMARGAVERPAEFSVVALTMAEPRRLVENAEHAVHIPELVALMGDLGARLQTAEAAGAMTPGDPRDRAIVMVFGGIGVLTLRKLARFDPSLDPLRLSAIHARTLLCGWGASAALLDSLAPLADQLAGGAD